MGRRTIPPTQRAQPISFSLKPHLIEKIDEYCTDHRFNRSKFLMQAVTEYMTRHLVHGTDLSSDVGDMTLDRRVAVGLAALQEANREGETISKPVMDALRRELKMNTDIAEEEQIDEFMATFGDREGLGPEHSGWDKVLHIYKFEAGNYRMRIEGKEVGSIVKLKRKWLLTFQGHQLSFPTLKAARFEAREMWRKR